MDKDEFQRELETLINRYSKENGSNTPDFILSDYLGCCLANFDRFVNWREEWYGRRESEKSPGPVELDSIEYEMSCSRAASLNSADSASRSILLYYSNGGTKTNTTVEQLRNCDW